MLAALLQNNNNARQQAQPGFKVDPRASSGRSHHATDGGEQRGQHFDLVDIIAAAATFPESAGEDPITRAARRYRWISEALPFVKEAREKREAAAFLVGARLADAAAEERHAAQAQAAEERHAAQTQLKIEQIVEIIDEVRRETSVMPAPLPRVPHERGGRSLGGNDIGGIGLFVGGLVAGGILVTVALRRRAARPPGAVRLQIGGGA